MTSTALEIRPLASDDVGDAARLLAARHRAQRLVEPGLATAFEDETVARGEIEALMAKDGASGAVALRDEAVIGYLIGVPRGASWGPNVWVEGAGHAVTATETEAVRDLYAFAAARWVADGATSHYAIVPATDLALIDAWFRLGFGQQHVHAIREAARPGDAFRPPAGVSVRRAVRSDISALGRLDLVLPEYQAASPVFSAGETPSLEEATNDWEEGFDDPRYTTFVAEHRGLVVGSVIACAIEASGEHQGIVQPIGAGFLGFAAVFPEARGIGAGRALGEAVLIWARDAGYGWVVVDWRETNLLASRTWPRLGFRPTFRRLYRAIA